MSTKSKGEIAEHEVVLEALRRGWTTLKPVVDEEKYDLVFAFGTEFARVQVKHGWFSEHHGCHFCDVRKTKTNRRVIRRVKYLAEEFDFAVVYVPSPRCFYVFPAREFVSYGSCITIRTELSRQRPPRSAEFLERWDLIQDWASVGESRRKITPSNSGEPLAVATPSQALVCEAREGVET